MENVWKPSCQPTVAPDSLTSDPAPVAMRHDSLDTDYGHPDTPSDRTRHNLEKMQLFYIERAILSSLSLHVGVVWIHEFLRIKLVFQPEQLDTTPTLWHFLFSSVSFSWQTGLPSNRYEREGDGKKNVMDMVIFPLTQNQFYLQTWCECRATRTSYVSPLCMWIPKDHFLPFVETGPLILLSVIASNTKLNNQNGITSFPGV